MCIYETFGAMISDNNALYKYAEPVGPFFKRYSWDMHQFSKLNCSNIFNFCKEILKIKIFVSIKYFK